MGGKEGRWIYPKDGSGAQASDASQMPTTGGNAIPSRNDRHGGSYGPCGQGTEEDAMRANEAATQLPLGEKTPAR